MRAPECFPLLSRACARLCNPALSRVGSEMANRRQFLQTGAVVSALAMRGLVPSEAAAPSPSRIVVPLHKAVYDPRYAECRSFAAAVQRLGVAVQPLEYGDVTSFWYDELDLLWRSRGASIAGTTQLGPMFVLERLANERRMRVVLRAEHQPQADGTIAHAISAPREALDLAAELCAAGLEWPAVMSALVCRCTSTAALASATLYTPGTKPELTESAAVPLPIHYYTPLAVQQGHDAALDGPLFSWVIA